MQSGMTKCRLIYTSYFVILLVQMVSWLILIYVSVTTENLSLPLQLFQYCQRAFMEPLEDEAYFSVLRSQVLWWNTKFCFHSI